MYVCMYIPDLVISSSFLLHCQVKRSLWFLHFIRPVFLERFVEFHRASGITCSEELWRERSSVASFTAALPCFVSSLRPPNEKFSACFRILFQQYISPAQLPGLISGENQNATKETTKEFFARPGGRGHRTAWFRRAFLVLLLSIPE